MAIVFTPNNIFSSDVFEVDDYGAAGNGTTDDSTAIQAAIDAAEAVGGGIVQLGAKSYGIGTTLRIDSSGVTFQGKNPNVSKLIALANDDSLLSVGSQSTSGSGKVELAIIRNIGFVNTASSTVYAVQAYGATYFFMSNCKIEDGDIGLQMRNCDMFGIEHTVIEVSGSGAKALNLIQGASDDITTGRVIGGKLEVTGTGGICVKLVDGPGDESSNEFNNIYFNGVKLDGSNVATTVGVDVEAGCRNMLFQNCEFKDLRGADIDASTNLDNGKKVFITIDNCKMLGNSTNPTTKKIILKQPSASGSATKLTMRGAGAQFHRFVDGIYVSAGEPEIYIEDMDASTGTNLIEVASGATPTANPRITVGNATIGSSVTNNRGTNLIASSAIYVAGPGNKQSDFALMDEGSVTVTDGNSTASISWTLDYVPNDRDITILPDNGNGGDTGDFWITSTSTSGATLNLRTAASGANKTFRWKVKAG